MKVINVIKRGWFSDTVQLEAELDEQIIITYLPPVYTARWSRYRTTKGKCTTVKLPRSMKLQIGDSVSVDILVSKGQIHGLWHTCGNGEAPKKK